MSCNLTSRSTGRLAGGAYAPSARRRLAWFVRPHRHGSDQQRRRRAYVALFRVVEDFRNDEAAPVYVRLQERGRLAPHGPTHTPNRVNEHLTTCYQVIETIDA